MDEEMGRKNGSDVVICMEMQSQDQCEFIAMELGKSHQNDGEKGFGAHLSLNDHHDSRRVIVAEFSCFLRFSKGELSRHIAVTPVSAQNSTQREMT
jgi:hypothetical protein